MATVPKAVTKVLDTAGVPAGGLDVCCIMSPCATNPDVTPRLFGTAKAIYDQHGYSEGVEYAALHFAATRKSVIFIGLPIVTPGVLSRRNSDGHTGTSNITVTADASGCLAEHDGVIEVVAGGTVGTSQIVLGLSLDGGRTFQKLRVGTGNSIAIPYFGVTIALGAGTLNTDDTVLSWHGTAPLSDSTNIDLARQRLAGQQKSFRSLLLIGDMQSHTDAASFLTALNTYETSNERFVYGRASVSDRLPLASSSSVRHVTAGASLTFVAASHTVTRAAGSYLTDDIATGDVIYCSGSASNNGTLGVASNVTGTVITFAAGLVNEGPTSAATITSRIALVFASSGNTITRNRGSWVDEGFKIGQTVTVAGTVSNNGSEVLTGVTATVLTFASGIVNETIGIGLGTVTQALTKAAWMAAQDIEYAPIDGPTAFRIDLSAGRVRQQSPFSQWNFRRPWSWLASMREYQHDLHIATWRKQDGPFVGADLFDEAGNLAEWDDRVDGGAGSAARFTTGRTWANGPQGAFVCQSLTRGSDGSLLSKTHNVAVVNLICTIVQLNTEDAAIGVSLVLNDDGTATTDSLSTIQKRVNDALELGVLVNAQGEGQRASKAVWTPDPSVVFNVPEPVMLGTCDTNLNGTVHSVNSSVRLRSGGQ
jgi:hypothetical protein